MLACSSGHTTQMNIVVMSSIVLRTHELTHYFQQSPLLGAHLPPYVG